MKLFIKMSYGIMIFFLSKVSTQGTLENDYLTEKFAVIGAGKGLKRELY